MDLRRKQEEEDIAMPFSLIRESSSKVSSSLPTTGEGQNGNNGNATTPHHQPLMRVRDQDQLPDQQSIGGLEIKTTHAQIIRYRECLKNHAATIGGHVLDGCGEFMPGGEDGTTDALKCAACECHRNFHRKEIEGETPPPPPSQPTSCHYCYKSGGRSRIPPPPTALQLPPLPALQPPPHLQKIPPFGLPTSPSGMVPGPFPTMMVAFGGGGSGATESSSEDLTVFQSNPMQSIQQQVPFAFSKKRFRTKFTQEQKEKMTEFAEKVGWRIQKQDELLVEELCAEVGVKRQVLKVWMHNNKHVMRKKES